MKECGGWAARRKCGRKFIFGSASRRLVAGGMQYAPRALRSVRAAARALQRAVHACARSHAAAPRRALSWDTVERGTEGRRALYPRIYGLLLPCSSRPALLYACCADRAAGRTSTCRSRGLLGSRARGAYTGIARLIWRGGRVVHCRHGGRRFRDGWAATAQIMVARRLRSRMQAMRGRHLHCKRAI